MEINPIINPCTMTATNINVEEFIKALMNIRNEGVAMINLDMTPDENYPGMNRIILHPIREEVSQEPVEEPPQKDIKNLVIKNPSVSRDNDDILNLLNQMV
jgi:hypothetical protein